MDNSRDLNNTLTYLQSELNRLETMAGTLATIELDHYNKLTNFDNREIADIAVEEQSASRQLGTMKHMCLAMAQKVEELRNGVERGEFGGSEGIDEIH